MRVLRGSLGICTCAAGCVLCVLTTTYVAASKRAALLIVIMTNGRARRAEKFACNLPTIRFDSIRFIARFGVARPRFESRFTETVAKLLYLSRIFSDMPRSASYSRAFPPRSRRRAHSCFTIRTSRCARTSSAMTELRRSSDLQITESRGVHDRVKSDSSRWLFRAPPLNSI